MRLTGPQRIELVWPTKGQLPNQSDAGVWLLADQDQSQVGLSPLLLRSAAAEALPKHITVTGDRLSALRTLRHACGRQVRLVYADVPRLEGFDESRAFQAGTGIAWNTWLSSLREYFRAVYSLLAEDGVLVVQAGHLEDSYAKIVLFEIFGHANYLGTIVWQSHYSPKGGKTSSELTQIHESLICFAYSRSHVERLALPVIPKDYRNPDSDPRGDWQARQKDAGRDTAKVTYNVPPYRWELIGGELPRGLWRLSPMSGVIWGTPSEAGSFNLKIQVTDADGNVATKAFQLEVGAEGELDLPTDVWWRANPPLVGGPLKITGSLPRAVAGKPYSAVLTAQGGHPFEGTPRPGRGWGFGEKTLIRAILEDRMSFGQKGTAIPEPKKYLADLEGGMSYTNVVSWWSGEDAGWTQDATKDLNDLAATGLKDLPGEYVIKRTNATSKPRKLLSRLLDIFTKQGDLVLELFARSGDLMATAIEKERSSIGLFGSSADDESFENDCAVPRMEHESRQRGQSAHLARYMVGDPLLQPPPVPGASVRLTSSYAQKDDLLGEAILTSQGFFPIEGSGDALYGESLDGRRRAVIFPPSAFLQQDDVDEFVSQAEADDKQPIVFYFRAAPGLGTSSLQAGLTLRRVPMDLSI
jgi:hypothetical protein